MKALLLLILLLPALLSAETPSLAVPPTDEGLPGAGPLRRADWFTELWLEKRTGWAAEVQKDQGALVFFGDSITQGWGDLLGKSFPGLKVANRGISGDTSRGLLVRLSGDVLALRPSGVVLLIGTNDIEEKAEPSVIAGNVELLLDQLLASNPEVPVVLCRVMPSSASKRRPAATIQKLNDLYQDLVKTRPRVTYLDTYTLFANADGDAQEAEFPDLLHPNEAGYAKWTAALLPVLATLGFTETEPDDFQPEEGFTSLFNGKDLTGWGFPGKDGFQSFDGQSSSPDGRYLALHGRLVVTTPPEGRRVQQLWTKAEFPADFILKLEFRATPNADSGIFLRKPQLQCRDYPLAGPYTELKNYKPQDWNEVVITVTGQTAHCTCNGEVLEAAFPLPATGPLGLEGDRGQMEYRRIRIKTP